LVQTSTLLRNRLQAARPEAEFEPPDSAPAWHLLGLISAERGDLSEAIPLLDKAIQAYQGVLRLKTGYFEVRSNLGGVLLDVGRRDEAIDHYREAARIRPDIAELHDNLGNALGIGGYCESAIACHKQALRLKPSLVTAWSQKPLKRWRRHWNLRRIYPKPVSTWPRDIGRSKSDHKPMWITAPVLDPNKVRVRIWYDQAGKQ
jgi:tetratricopeptide (TPR) repeat protein